MLTATHDEDIMGTEKRNKGRITVDTKADTQSILYIMPAGHKRIGSVRCGNEPPGVLALVESSGQYVQITNYGSTRALDQRKVKSAIENETDQAGPVGRPRMSYEERKVFSVSLEPSLAEYFRELGEGNLSAGISKIGTAHRDRAERKRANKLVDVQTGK